MSNYFGRSSRSTIDISENLSQLETKLEAKLRAKFTAEFEQKMSVERQLMQQTFMETLKSMGFTQTSQTNKEIDLCPTKVVIGSTKGSCTAAPDNHTKDSTTDNVQKLLSLVLELEDDILVPLEHDPFVVAARFWIPPKCIKELLIGDMWLDFSVLQIWCT